MVSASQKTREETVVKPCLERCIQSEDRADHVGYPRKVSAQETLIPQDLAVRCSMPQLRGLTLQCRLWMHVLMAG